MGKPGEKPPHANRLAKEQSPYLLQHARNPVDWFPWGPEAFEKAKKEDKPVFLSIGYSTCHWCHVMERESFEDPEVARLMNEAFVSVKVDREERPDIDALYMSACQMVTGSGGWPLTIVMTPDGKPFFAATYIPKTARFGRMGILELVPRIREMWRSQRQNLLASAEQVAEALRESSKGPSEGDFGPDLLEVAYEQLARRFDEVNAGFGTAPKFPTPHNLLFLLRHWMRSGDPKAQRAFEPSNQGPSVLSGSRALEMVERTLRAMRLGGVYDHIGFGFHRYSTDPEWLVPHFEKMLYDQALLALAYTEGFQATGRPEFRWVAEEVIEYVLRGMTSPEGGFYSAEDADSEGEEGKFYLWTEEEVRQVLGSDADLVLRAWNVEKGGNFVVDLPEGRVEEHRQVRPEATGRRAGGSILFLARPLADVAAAEGMVEAELRKRLGAARQKLLAAREKRVRPLRDDKILTDWNGLMIAALARAGQVFGSADAARAARSAAGFVLSKMRDSRGRLLHRYRARPATHPVDDSEREGPSLSTRPVSVSKRGGREARGPRGEAAIPGTAEDYAFLVWGLLELYEATFEARWLEEALRLSRDLMDRFWDPDGGGFFLTPSDGEALIARSKEIHDGALPSANSVAMLNLLRLARMTGDISLEERAAAIGRAFAGTVRPMPAAHAMFMCGLDFAAGPSKEVVIVGEPGAADTEAMARALRKEFAPRKVVLFKPAGEARQIETIAPYTRHLKAIGGKATAYVCANFACEMPTTDPALMVELLRK